MIMKMDLVGCLQEEAACSLECLKSVVVASESRHHHSTPMVESKADVCQMNCALDSGKCLIQTFDLPTCVEQEKKCALGCLNGGAFVSKWSEPVMEHVSQKQDAACQKNCAIDLGKCIITTGNVPQCIKEEGACSLECLKTLNVFSSMTYVQQTAAETC